MAFPNLHQTLREYLGYRVTDRVTGLSGVVTSVCFDLYGCVQATVSPGLDKDGKVKESFWIDISRLQKDEVARVMTPPSFSDSPPQTYDQGAAEKPRRSI